MTDQKPLTAEQIASQIITDVRGWCYYDNYNDAAESSLRFNTNADAVKNIEAYAAQEVANVNQNVLVWHPIETFPDFYPAPLLIKQEDPEEGVEYGLAEWSCSGECWVDPKFTGIKENYTHWAYIDKEGDTISQLNPLIAELETRLAMVTGTLSSTRDWLQMQYVDGESHPSLGDAIISLNTALNATDASVEAWKARQNNGAYQRGYAEAERLGNIEIERLKQALQNVIKNDKTYYNHHDPRPDGRLPKEDGGTIWLTPKEIAKRALPQPPKEGN